MPTTRRPSLGDRRRLVIYSQRLNEDSAGPIAGVAERSSDAKRSQAAYGSRVQRRLRARWYGLVPVKNRTLLAVAAVLFGFVALLGMMHWCAFWWAPIAAYPEVARPFRLDRPDSFGTWFSAILLAATAGASFLVYQLRRYKSDDYHGHYRIWRIAIVLSLVASIDCVTGLIGWLGGTLDVLLAERDFLAGADWVRLLLGFGGAAFALRMVTEISRSGWAATVLGLSFVGYAVPLAVRWKLVDAQVGTEAVAVPIVITLARAGTMLAVVIYLRLLYREVRRIESGERLTARLRGMFKAGEKAEREVVDPVPTKARASRRRAASANAGEEDPSVKKSLPVKRPIVAAEGSRDDSVVASVAAPPPRQSLWSKLRRSKSESQDNRLEVDAGSKEGEVVRNSPKREGQIPEESSLVDKKRSSWLKLPGRQRSIGKVKVEIDVETVDKQELDAATSVVAKVGAGNLGGWFRSRKNEAADDSVSENRRVADRGRVAKRGEQEEGKKGEEDVFETTSSKIRWLGMFGGKAKSSDVVAELGDGGSVAGAFEGGVKGSREASGPTPAAPVRPAAASVKQEASRSQGPGAVPVVSGSPSRAQDDEDESDEDAGDGADTDPDSVDWATLNKSERRRMRKVMKRQGKAA